MLINLLRPIKKWFLLARFQKEWRDRNKHNETWPNNIFPIDCVKVGKGTYADLNVYSYRNNEEKLVIGNYCSIASDNIFVLSGEHYLNRLTTYPFGEKVFHNGEVANSKGPIVIEDDVWIGVRCTFLSGVTVGQGSVIAANSTIYHDIPPYSIWGGERLIRKRFPDVIIDRLIKLDFGRFTEKDIENYREYTSVDLTLDNYKQIINQFPQKA